MAIPSPYIAFLPPCMYCQLDAAGKTLLDHAVTRLGLSARAYGRILRVSKTIADLGESDMILSAHVAEAIQYRNLDRPIFS